MEVQNGYYVQLPLYIYLSFSFSSLRNLFEQLVLIENNCG